MISEEIEFQISQYVDGTLSAPQRKIIDDLVLSDPGAAKVLADYRRLNSHLGSLRTATEIQWDRLSDRISGAIDNADEPAVAGRIGFFHSRWRIAATVLVAASALLVARHAMRSQPAAQPIAPAPVVDVQGPQAEVAAGRPTEDVSVGPSPALAARDSRYGEGVIGQGPSKVVIVGEAPKPPADSHLH
jgi:anti-sigma-K factor RskA